MNQATLNNIEKEVYFLVQYIYKIILFEILKNMSTTTGSKLQQLLSSSKGFFIVWCMIAAFGTYFCMYAFRKPFSAGTYSEYKLWGIDYKAVLIIAQVFGYMLSKFAGIKVISELKASSRRNLIIVLILIAEVA